jgi:hypothetical protein
MDGNIFNKHNDQEKKTLVKMIFFTCMEFNKLLQQNCTCYHSVIINVIEINRNQSLIVLQKHGSM